MKFTLSINLFFIIAGLLFTGCKKPSENNIEISILSPEDGAVFSSGDTIRLQVAASDNEDLHEMKLEIKDGANILLGLYPYVHAKKSHTLDTSIIAPAVSAPTLYSLEAEAEDHDYNAAKEIFSITVNP